MKRRLLVLLLCVLMMSVIVLPASAETSVTKINSIINVTSDGDCQVSMSVMLHLESTDNLTFPLPVNATNITMNGSSARTNKTASAIEVDISRITGGMVGDFTVSFSYTIPDAVSVYAPVDEEGQKIIDERYLQLTLPLLCGFSGPVNALEFVVTLPGNVVYKPQFTSIYLQDGIESNLPYNVDKNMITGSSTTVLNDHEGITMKMVVPSDMFPSVSTYIRTGNPELVPLLVCIGLALVYWIAALRTLPLRRSRNVSPPDDITAGEIGCHLTLAGGDLTMMVMNWAQLGYILIHMDGSRVMLHKRMDMGNERSAFEVKVFKLLFGTRRVVDATGSQYAKLCRKVGTMIPGEKSLCKPFSGNMKLFRALCCGAQIFCGICVAMNMTTIFALQLLLSIILGVFGAVSAWQIQEIAYRTHLRGKTRVYIGLVCVLIWIVLGLLCGEWIIPLCTTLGQWALGYFAAYGGRRSDMGRYDAGRILGLRSFLKNVSKEETARMMKNDPDYFFNLAPYAMAMGIIRPFAKNFGSRKLSQCPYLVTRVSGKRTADEWADLLVQAADRMDARQRRMEIEKWFSVPIRRTRR